MISKDNIQKKTLSIRLSTNGFCFCTYTRDSGSLRYSFYTPDKERSMASNIEDAIADCPLIRHGEEYEVKAIIESSEYTCIPSEYDIRSDYDNYFRYCFPQSRDAEIIANRLNAQECTVLFPVEKSICEAVRKLGNTTFYTPASILMGYLNYRPMGEERYIFSYLYNDTAIILSMKENKVELSNIFSNEEIENVLFYLLSIWKEQRLSQTDDTLYLCGDNAVERMSQLAGKFIKKIKRINPNELFSPSLLNRMEGIPFDLQALILCE